MSKSSIGFVVVLMVSLAAFAQDGDEDREPASASVGRVAAGQLNKARYRLYSGGQDEQDLKVQAVLPVPTRYPENQGGGAPASGATGEE